MRSCETISISLCGSHIYRLAGAVALALAIVLLSSTTLEAQQGPPLLAGSFDFLPLSNIDNPITGTFEEDLEVRVNNPRFELNVPARLGGGTILINGVVYSLLKFDLEGGFPRPASTPDDLHDLSYRAILMLPLSDRWRITLSAQPGIASDFENIEGNHFRFQGGLLFSTTLGEATTVGFGGVVQNNFGQALPLPALNVQWRGRSARVNLQLPRTTSFLLRAGQVVEIGIAGNVEGGFYRLGRDGAQGDRVKYSVVSVGPALNAVFTPRFLLKVAGGLALARRFEIQDENSDELRTIDLEPGSFIRFTFEVRPPLPAMR